MDKIRSRVGTALFAVITLLCLYYMEDGYFNTILAKTHAFYASAVIAVVTCIVMDVIAYAKEYERLKQARSMISVAMIMFFLSYVVSALLCGNTDAAFSGDTGWNVGVMAYFCGLLMYFVMRDLKPSTSETANVLAIAGIPFFLFAVFHGTGVDIFSLHTELLKDEHYNYISTAGNIDVYAGIVSLFIPVIAALYMNTKKAWLLVPIFLAGMGLAFSSVDSGYIGLFGGLAFLFVMMSYRKTSFIHINRVVMTLSGSFLPAEIFQRYDGRAFPAEKYISFFMNKYYLALGLFCITVVTEIVLRFRNSEFVISPWIMLMLVALVIFLAVLFFIHGVDKSDRFGNSRLIIWQKAVQVYADGGIREKLFGIGPDMFGNYSQGIAVGGRNVVNCHCSILQHLVCGGIVTLVCYFFIVAAVLWKVYRARKVSPFFFGLAGYFFQSQLNNPQNMLLPFACIFLALL